MQYLDEKLDVVANNIANSNTNGFKRSGVAFNQSMVAEQSKIRDKINTDPLPRGEIKTYIEMSQGHLNQTSNPLNFALDGEGFFTILTPNGYAWTREGVFTHDDDGYLATMDGYRVVGEYNGPIRLFGSSFSVSDAGDIVVDGRVVNRFLIQNFEMSEVFQHGNNLYFPRNFEEQYFTEPNAKVRQGYLETSNVAIVKEMIEMIAINRQYQANEKAIRTNDEALNKSVNNIAR
jgi:flagellar basal-body rod protein FlgG